MKLRTLEPKDEPLMLELLRSEKASRDSDYYLDRGQTFWGLYDWFSKGKHYAHGVFDEQKLVGMVAVVSLPFHFKGSQAPIFLATDMLIHPDYRKSFAAARLFTALHTVMPGKDFINVWIENRAGFAEAIPKFSKRFDRATEYPRETNLITLYPNQNVSNSANSVLLQVTDNWDDIETHLRSYQANEQSWVNWNSQKINIRSVFKSVRLFKISSGQTHLSGLIVDRSNLQKIRWNGQTRLLIEKYRRSLLSKNINLVEEDELPFATVAFVINSNPVQKISIDIAKAFCQWGFENSYFGINFRDLDIEKSEAIDRVDFSRRIFLSSDQSETELARVAHGLAKHGVALESVYL